MSIVLPPAKTRRERSRGTAGAQRGRDENADKTRPAELKQQTCRTNAIHRPPPRERRGALDMKCWLSLALLSIMHKSCMNKGRWCAPHRC